MINKKYLKLSRSRSIHNNNFFIYEKIGKNIIDSIDLIKINFDEILELGINENEIYKKLKDKFPSAKFTRSDIIHSKTLENNYENFLTIDLDKLDLKKNNFNLIFSNFFSHLSSDFEKLLRNIHLSLKSNGLFIATIPDIDNIKELTIALFKTDMELYNGVYQRINPTINIEKVLSFLKKNNFDTPTINSDNIRIEYKKFKDLLFDLKSTKLSYCYTDKKKFFENKNYFKLLEKNFKNEFGSNEIILNIKFNVICAWKK